MTVDQYVGSLHTRGALGYHNVPLSCKEHVAALLSVNRGETVTIAINPFLLAAYLK
jgi:hypothetical protein